MVVLLTLQSVYCATFAAFAKTKNDKACEPVADPMEFRLPCTMSFNESPLMPNVPVVDPLVATVESVNDAVP